MPTKTPSTAVAVKKTSGTLATTDVRAMLEAMVAQNAKKTAPAGGNAIRVTQDKHMILPDGSKTTEMQVVVIEFTSRNEFYEGAFDKNNIRPPACFAIGDVPTELVPSPNSPTKQAESCSVCPMNVFGSAGTGKACKNTRMLAVLPPDADESTPIWTIKVSPTAIKGFDGYVKNVQRMFGVPPVGVVTTVTFDENADYAQLKFSDPTPNENAGIHLARLTEAREILATEPDVSAFDAPAATPTRKGAAPAKRHPAVARR